EPERAPQGDDLLAPLLYPPLQLALGDGVLAELRRAGHHPDAPVSPDAGGAGAGAPWRSRNWSTSPRMTTAMAKLCPWHQSFSRRYCASGSRTGTTWAAP